MASPETGTRTARGEAPAKIDAFGLDAICEEVGNGASITAVAKKIGVAPSTLLVWIDADPPRTARVNETRRMAARLWDEKAEDGIAKARNPFALAKAKELAHHYRWRAAKIAPKEFGDKMALTDGEGKPLQGAVPPVFNVTVKGK